MRKHGGVTFGPDAGELLRARGLRVTPQRRAILGAFSHGADEHLSADEIHARAAAVVPELGRGTVYAALAELTELGLLAARGSPEPVRYETNTEPHQHFRCRLCLRLFDVALADPALAAEGFIVEQITITAEGICAECVDYDKGLRAAAKRARRRPAPELPEGLAATTVTTPRRPLTLGATADGVMRAVFDDHADVPALQAIDGRRGSRAARGHLAAAKARSRRTSPATRPGSARSTGSGCPGRRPCAPRWRSRAPSSPPTTPSTRPRRRASAASCWAPTRSRSSSPAIA